MIPSVQLVLDEWSDVIILVSITDDLGRRIQNSLKLVYSGERTRNQESVTTIYYRENKIIDESLGYL